MDQECQGMANFSIVLSHLGLLFMSQKNLTRARKAMSQAAQTAHFYVRLQQRMPWWRQNTQDPSVLHLITYGVTSAYPMPNCLSMPSCVRNQQETQLVMETIQEYLEVGAIKEIPLHQAKHLIPWFVIKKGEKLRLITNCKELKN